MSQNSLNVPDGTGAQVRANINLALDTLNTLNSGPSSPANPEAFMLWADTGTGYLRQRDATNSTWVALRPLDGSVPVSTNSGNNYSISLDPAISAYVSGVIYKFIPNAGSTGVCTLSINGLSAIAIPGANLQANQPVLLLYDAIDAIFVMAGGGGGSAVGSIVAYGGSTPPSGWLLCNGQAVSRSTYSSLFSVLQTAFGVGNGSTTFNLPNLQERVPVGSATGLSLGTIGGGSGTPGLLAGTGHTCIAPEVGILLANFDNTGTQVGWEVGYDVISAAPYQVVNYIIKY